MINLLRSETSTKKVGVTIAAERFLHGGEWQVVANCHSPMKLRLSLPLILTKLLARALTGSSYCAFSGSFLEGFHENEPLDHLFGCICMVSVHVGVLRVQKHEPMDLDSSRLTRTLQVGHLLSHPFPSRVATRHPCQCIRCGGWRSPSLCAFGSEENAGVGLTARLAPNKKPVNIQNSQGFGRTLTPQLLLQNHAYGIDDTCISVTG
jgi:hypothetical protein